MNPHEIIAKIIRLIGLFFFQDELEGQVQDLQEVNDTTANKFQRAEEEVEILKKELFASKAEVDSFKEENRQLRNSTDTKALKEEVCCLVVFLKKSFSIEQVLFQCFIMYVKLSSKYKYMTTMPFYMAWV